MTAYCSVLLSEAAKVHTFSAPVEVHVLLNKRLSVIGSEMYFYEYKSKKKKSIPLKDRSPPIQDMNTIPPCPSLPLCLFLSRYVFYNVLVLLRLPCVIC